MKKTRIVIALILSIGTLSGAGTAMAQAPIDQANWSSFKKPVRLASGIQLSYVELGDPKGEPLLLLHGFTDTSRSWSLMATYLSSYRLLIPDQRGHGVADAPRCCYSTYNYADDARQFMDALGIRKAAIAGHSMGSMVAITMAAEYPDRVSKIVLIGSTALTPVNRGDWLYENVAALKGPLDPQSQFMKEWHPANQPTPVDATFAAFAMDEILDVPLHVWRGVMRELANVPAGRHAADVKAPVLILSGGKDPLFPPEHHRSLVAAFPTGEAHSFPDLGHNLSWERPRELSAIISDFLDRRPGP